MARGLHIGTASAMGGNATANDILTGKSAYVDGEEILGSMINNGALEEFIATSVQPILVPEGYHNGNGFVEISAEEQAKLVATNIRKDITILGVQGSLQEGIDTQDADATAGDILSGKIGFVNGAKITGNIGSQAAKTVTPAATAQTAVSAGTYCSGAITVDKIPNQTTGGAKYATTSAQTVGNSGKYYTSNITLGALSQSNLAAGNIIKGKTITISNGSSNVWSVTGSNNALRYTSGSKGNQGAVTYTMTNGSSFSWRYISINPGMTPAIAVGVSTTNGEKLMWFRNGNAIFFRNPSNSEGGSYTWKSGGSWTSSNTYICGQASTIYYWIFGY